MVVEDTREREKRLARKASRRVAREVAAGMPEEKVAERYKKLLKRYLADPNA